MQPLPNHLTEQLKPKMRKKYRQLGPEKVLQAKDPTPADFAKPLYAVSQKSAGLQNSPLLLPEQTPVLLRRRVRL